MHFARLRPGLSQIGIFLRTMLQPSSLSGIRPDILRRSTKSFCTSRASYDRASSTGRPIICIDNSSIYPLGAGASTRPLFRNVVWSVNPEDAWAVLSVGSSSGKTFLLQALLGHLRISPPPPPPDGLFPFLQGRDSHKAVSLVSFAHRSRAAGGAFVDFTARYGAVREEDKQTLRETFFPETAQPRHNLAIPSFHPHPDISLESRVDQEKDGMRRVLFAELTEKLGLTQFLDLPTVALSNGQTRKARIVKALLEQPELLILDEPLTGLDAPTRGLVLSLLQTLHASPDHAHIIMGSRSQDPLPDWTTHVALVHSDGTVHTGRREEIMASHTISSYGWTADASGSCITEKEHLLIDLDNVNVTYGDRKVLTSISWQVRANSRWHLLGANGAGKTTLLAMLTGEHPQSYTQSANLRLFSRPRAKWPTPHLHARIGRVSPELHNAYPRRPGVKVWDVIGTAFDGGFVPRGKRRVGLSANGEQLEEGGEEETRRIERVWHVLEGLGPTAWEAQVEQESAANREAVVDFANRQFMDLSPGEQSIVLLMRALVHQPPLVLLDEAWAGMDESMVQAARRYLREGGGLSDGQACIVISHWEDEVPWSWEDGVRRFQLVGGIGRELLRPTSS